MKPAIAVGVVVLILGTIVAGDAKMFGFKGPSIGIAIAAAGGFLALFGMYGGAQGGNREGGGRRVRDHSV